MQVKTLFVTSILAGIILPVEALAYTYTELSVPGLTGAVATAVNNRGDIVGYGTGSTGTVGFLDCGGAFALISFPGSITTQANGINDADEIVGTYHDAAGSHGFKYSRGNWITIDAPEPAQANTTGLTAINNVGQIAGFASVHAPATTITAMDGFVYTAGNFAFAPTGPLAGIDINGLNDSGDIAGGYSSPRVPEQPAYGKVATYRLNQPLSNGYYSAINDGGQLIYSRGGLSYLQSSATQTSPGTPIFFQGSSLTAALGLNNTGTIVGYWIDSAHKNHAFVAAVTPSPSCIVATSAGPPRQMSFSIQDTSGLAQIAVTGAINANTTLPPFVRGTTSAIVVSSLADNPRQTQSVTVTATNTAGASSVCSASIRGDYAQWIGLGGVLTSDIGPGINSDGSLDAHGLGSDFSLWHLPQSGPGGPWGAWSGLGGTHLASEPAVAVDSVGNLELVVITSDGLLWNIAQTAPGSWSGATLHTIASGVKGRPALIRNANGQLQAFARAADDEVLSLTQSSPGSLAWQAVSLGGVVISNPAAVLDFSNTVQVVALGTDYALWNTSISPVGGIAPWRSAGGALKGDPALVTTGNVLYAFARASDNSVWFNWQTSANPNLWQGAQSLGGQIVDNPRAIVNFDGRAEVFVAGTDHAVWHIAQITGDGLQWGSWSTLGGIILGDVIPALDASGAVNLFVRGADSGLWSMTQPAAGFWQ